MSTTKSGCSYTGVHYWDGSADEMVEANIGVRDGLFADAGNDKAVKDLSVKDLPVKDLGGLYAIPGLIDAHIHLCLNPEIRDPLEQDKLGREALLEQMRVRVRQMLNAGITTARDLGGGQHLELTIRDEINSGATAGPRLLCAGQPITSPGGHCHFWGGEADSTGSALEVLERQHQAGVDLIKVMATGGNITPGSRPVDSQFEDETLNDIVSRAAEHGYHVAAHCHGTHGIRQAVQAGVRTVEHCSWVNDAGWGRGYDDEVVLMMARQGTWVSPTINSGWRRYKDAGFISLVQGNYASMRVAGIPLIASTDAGIPNVFHDDLPRALPEFARFAGLSNQEVLTAATSDCALAIGLGETTGRIAKGYSADFVCYEKNPLEDLTALQQPVLVVSRGVEFAV